MRRWLVLASLMVAPFLSGCQEVDALGRDTTLSLQRLGEDQVRQTQWFIDDCAREIELLLE